MKRLADNPSGICGFNMAKFKLGAIALFLFCSSCNAYEYEEISKGTTTLQFLADSAKNYAQVTVRNEIITQLEIQLGVHLNWTNLKKISQDGECFRDDIGDYTLCFYYDKDIDSGYKVSWRTTNTSFVFQDCIKLNKGKVSWYGGQEIYEQLWPVEKLNIKDMAYITNGQDNGAVKEGYWLNSLGAYIVVDKTTPLYIDINNQLDGYMCLSGKLGDEYYNRREVVLNYTIVSLFNPKSAHLHATKHYLGKPSAHPDNLMIKEPIWTTWAKYKSKIDDNTVIDFASEIQKRGYTGQIEIDDKWEPCYGQRVFDKGHSFPNITLMVQKLKEMGFRVTLWTHPFVNDECPDAKIGDEKGYFVKNVSGSSITSWWDGSKAHLIDFTKTEAQNWFFDKLKKLQELYGIDSFKFDAGEATFAPRHPILNASVDEWPNKLTEEYLRTCARFGNLTEVRSGWGTQDLEVFVRMIDKDSKWGYDNGLKSLITTLLQMNMAGYSFVLPDMIGGNGYQGPPTPELLVRWTQANTFMPSMQFSYLPWEITSPEFDVPGIVREHINLHYQYGDEIIKAMKKHIKDGTPVNPPIWWIDPSNSELWAVDDQYLLGENIMVAPVVEQGAVKRDIHFPRGRWTDGNYGNIIEGPTFVKDYAASIKVLPWFIKA